jgi:hypothetical protein
VAVAGMTLRHNEIDAVSGMVRTFTIALADSIPHPGLDSARRLIAA